MPLKTYSFPEIQDGNYERSQVDTIPNLKSAVVSSKNPTDATVRLVLSGDNLTVFVSGGSARRSSYSSTRYSKTGTGSRTSGVDSFPDSISYDDGSYSGSIGKSGSSFVISGSYTAEDTKNIVDYVGWTNTETAYYDAQGKYKNSTYSQGSNASAPSTVSYSSGGYSGTLNYSRTTKTGGTVVSTGGPPNGTITVTYEARYNGPVTKPASDTRTWQQNYSGTVYQGGYYYYYAYDITVDYVANLAPTAPTITSPANDSKSASRMPTIQWTFNDPDAGDTQSAYYIDVWKSGVAMWNSGWVTSSAKSHTLPAGALTSDGTYQFYVYTKDAAGAQSPISAGVNIVIDTVVPNASTFTVGNRLSTSIAISGISAFNDPAPSSGHLARFVVVNNADGTTRLQTNTVANGATSYTISGLSPNTTYRIAVQDQDQAGNYGGLNWTTVKTNALPVASVSALVNSGYLINERPPITCSATDTDGSGSSLHIQISNASNFSTLLIDSIADDSVSGSTNSGWKFKEYLASGGVNTYTPSANLGNGTKYVRVRAYDGGAGNGEWGNWSATYTFTIQAPGWTDVIDDNYTGFRSVWITELRTKVNAVRQARGLATFTFEDATIPADDALPRKVHMDQLRTAVADVYTVLGLPTPTWTDANIAVGVMNGLVVTGTDRKGKHINEIRNALAAA